jgi:hypothetical protein
LTPDNGEAWGWRQRLIGTGGYAEQRWEAQGVRVGWLDADALYLDRAAAFRAASEMDADNGIGVSAETLTKRLYQGRYLASISSEREGRLAVQRRLEGTKRRVLHLRLNADGAFVIRQTGDTGDTGDKDRSSNSREGLSPPESVPGGSTSAPETGDRTGDTTSRRAEAAGAVPGGCPRSGSLKEGQPGTEKAVSEPSAEYESAGSSPASPVSPESRANERAGNSDAANGHRRKPPDDRSEIRA